MEITNIPSVCKKCHKTKYGYGINWIHPDFVCQCPEKDSIEIFEKVKEVLGENKMINPAPTCIVEKYILTKANSTEVYSLLVSPDTLRAIEWVLARINSQDTDFVFTEVQNAR